MIKDVIAYIMTLRSQGSGNDG